jgi:hypothetical protein
VTLTHLDEHGAPCTAHGTPNESELLALALVGARAPSFHHDLASKLQGLMMSLDEIGEISGDSSPGLSRALEGSHASLREVLALLAANRALTKTPIPTRVPFSELLQRAADRVSIKLSCASPSATIEGSVPALTHAFSTIFDLAAGPGRGRAVHATAVVADRSITTTVEVAPNAALSPVHLALAGFALAQAGGDLRCASAATQLVLRLPTAG